MPGLAHGAFEIVAGDARHRPGIGPEVRIAVRDPNGFAFEQLKRRLLRQQDVAENKCLARMETPHPSAPAVAVKLFDILLEAVPEPITRPALAADHVKMAIALVLPALLRRQVRQQKLNAALFRRDQPASSEGVVLQRPQNAAHEEHQPPCKCGTNRVSSTSLSNLPSSLPGLPSPLNAAARKPALVNWRNRSSASATACASVTSNSWRESPKRSITMWTRLVLAFRSRLFSNVCGDCINDIKNSLV